jgi:hypothetical protein
LRLRAISLLIVEGALPNVRAISAWVLPLSSILDMVSRSSTDR